MYIVHIFEKLITYLELLLAIQQLFHVIHLQHSKTTK